MTSKFSVADYAGAFRSLLPRGRVWPSDPGSVQATFAGVVAKAFQRADANAIDLLTGTFPARADALLPEWEATVGLPDECGGTGGSKAQRRAQVVSRLQAGGGQSPAYYIALAATMGFEVEIRSYAPFRVGVNAAGQPLYGDAWAFAWGVVVLSSTGDFTLSTLKCQLGRAKSAHTVITYPSA